MGGMILGKVAGLSVPQLGPAHAHADPQLSRSLPPNGGPAGQIAELAAAHLVRGGFLRPWAGRGVCYPGPGAGNSLGNVGAGLVAFFLSFLST